MGKTIFASVMLALMSAGSASAATVSPTLTASYSITSGTNITFCADGSGSSTCPDGGTAAGEKYYELVVGANDAWTTFTMLDVNPDTKSVEYSLFADLSAATNASSIGDPGALLKVMANDVGTVFSYLLLAGAQYVLRVDPNNNTTYTQTNISAVPLPAAAWLFGSALVGFMVMSNRRKV